jgi:hypothetical protein
MEVITRLSGVGKATDSCRSVVSESCPRMTAHYSRRSRTVDESIERTVAASEDQAPDAAEGTGHPVRPDDDSAEVEGHTGHDDGLVAERTEDVEGHNAHIGG